MEQAIDNTVEALCAGLTVLYPTDTIWGVGCDATQPSAVEAVYALKRRDPHKSMLVLAAPEWLEGMAYNEAARMLLGNGRPTTVVMPVTELPFGSMIAANLPADDGTVGVRLPIGSDFCINLLRQFGRPIVSTSANFSGQPSPATYADIDPELIKAVGYAVPSSAGACGAGRTSRILRVNPDGSITTLRP